MTTLGRLEHGGDANALVRKGLRTAASQRIVLFVAGVWTLSSAGCGLSQWVHNGFKVGPEYCKPAAPVASEWIDQQNPNIKSTSASMATWWTAFSDPKLNELVVQASRQNINLRVAGMRILEAQYQRQIAVGTLFPQLQEALGSYSRNKISANVANAAPNLWFSNWDAGLNASWELDFWGRFRRAVEAADAELDASIENCDDVLVLLQAEVASSYVELRTFQVRRQLANKNRDVQARLLQTIKERVDAGKGTQRDVEMARTILEQTTAVVFQYEASQRLANNRLCVLLGLPPQDLAASWGEDTDAKAKVPAAQSDVAVGIPADLVRRRPDVRKVERDVAAQSARIGIAASDLYPHFSINGTFGVAAASFGNLADGNRSTFGGIGPAFRWDVLNYGRIVNNVRVQDARFEAAAYAYQEKVLQAAREVEDAVVKFLKNHERSKSLDASVDAAAKALDITMQQLDAGRADYIPVFLMESQLTQVEDSAAAARGDIAQSLIELYRALGGGWEMRLMSDGELEAESRRAPAFQPEPERRQETPISNEPPPAPLPEELATTEPDR